MATWEKKQDLTTFDFRSVASDGTDIYFVQYGGGANYQVFKYDVSADTISVISTDASWGVTAVLSAMAAGGLTVSCLQWFDGELYVSVYAAADGNPVRVYRYDGTGTAWTNVLATTIASGTTYFGLFCTASNIVLGRSSHAGDIIDWGYYSDDGDSWSAVTAGNTPAAYAGNRQAAGYTIRQGSDKIVFYDKSDNTADYNHRWFEWDDAGNLTITNYTENIGGGGWIPSDAWLRDPGHYFADIYHWYLDGTIWKYAAALGDVWGTPTNHQQGGIEIFPVVSIGFTDQCGDHDGNFVMFSSVGVWGTPETVTGGTAGVSHVARLLDSTGVLFAALGSDAAIYVRSEPFVAGNELYYTGLAADNADLYLSGGYDGALKLYAYNLETLTQVSEASLGAASFADIISGDRGIIPIAKPGNDGVVLVRGRDGNNNQVLLSDDYGATFADVSDAGWDVGKYCIGLIPDPLDPDDLVACFDDNDLYRSEDGTSTWTKTADAPVNLRAAARHTRSPSEMLLGGETAGTIRFTNSYGDSFNDVSAAVGTINVIEVSR